jgi:glycosyltransferase involved in cell wall biosynthesis
MEKHRLLPKISVITVTYNSIRFVEDCIKSVIKQNYPNLEYIIIDGGSTDGTIDIIKKYEEHISYWISEPDKGPPDASNKGVKVATGDLVNLLNSDDLYADNALFEVADKYKDLPEDIDIITCGVRVDFLDSKKKSILHTETRYLNFNMKNILFYNTYVSGYFFRRRVILGNPFTPLFKDGSIFISNDSEFAIRIALKGHKNTVIPDPLCILQSSEDSFTFSGKNLVRIREEWCSMALEFLDKTEDSIIRKQLKKFYSKSLTSLIMCHIADKDFSSAIGLFSAELKRNNVVWVYRFITELSFIIYRKYKREKLSILSLSN